MDLMYNIFESIILQLTNSENFITSFIGGLYRAFMLDTHIETVGVNQ